MPADRFAPQHDHRHDELAHPDSHPKDPPKQSARRRAYAKRSCLKCREKKARCELPERSLHVPSSLTPLTSDLACHRCKVLSLDCVVWDGDRKRRPKVSSSPVGTTSTSAKRTSAATPIKPESSSSRLPSSPPRSPGSLEQLAAAAARLSDQRATAYHDAPDMSPHAASSSNDATSSREAASTLASVQFFNPVPDDVATPTSASSTPSMRTHHPSSLHALSTSNSDYTQSFRHTKPSSSGSAASPNNAASSFPSSSASKGQPPGRTWTSLWRPLSVLIDYAAQQPGFGAYLLSRIDHTLTDLDILDLIPRSTLAYLKPFLKPYLLWHPHLPGLEQMYADHRKRPTVSSALLLSSMCLVACRHAMPLTDPLPVQLSTLVDQLGTQILLSTPRDMYTVQALELLLAHEPSLVGTGVAGSAQTERGNGLLGESLLAAALTIARGLDLDKAIDSVVEICRHPPPTHPKQAQQRRDTLARHMAGASLWYSFCIWEGHFSFVNSTVRPIQLNDVTEKAGAMVAIDNDGRKIKRMHRDPFQSIEKRFPGLDEDSVLRSAGRTGLVYRLQAMERFQDVIAGMYRILATAAKPEPAPSSSTTSLTPTTPETRQQILDLLSSSSHKQVFWQVAKAQAFSPFASVRPALLLEDWATMESYSLQELLPCLAICAFMTGELNHGFSANEMVDALRFDDSFRAHAANISDRRDAETHSLLSTFHLFDRGLGYSQPDILTRGGASQSNKQRGSLWMEATGAPLLLTTAFATDGCKTFLEKTACSLHGFDFLPVTVDMHMAMMVNTLHRLDECDRNEYLPPHRHKRSSMPPPSRRIPSLTPDLTDSKDQATPGKSISQIGVLFIEEMVQVMQKWKLGASLQRTIPLQFRHILGTASDAAGGAATPEDRKSQPSSTDASMPSHASPKQSASSHQPSAALQQNYANSTQLIPDTTSHPHANGSGQAANLDQSQAFPQSFQNNFISGLPQQQQPTNLTAATGGNGGMFDIPMFDLFGPASTTDWTDNVPWFDPVDNGGSAPAALSLSSFANGQATPSQWNQYHQPPSLAPTMQNSWPAPSRQRSSDTLPPLQYTSTHQPSPTPQSNAYNAAHPAYPPQPIPKSAAGLGSAYGEQGNGSSHPYALGNGAAGQHYHHQQQQQQSPQAHYSYQQQQQAQQQPPYRPYYDGGSNHHGGR